MPIVITPDDFEYNHDPKALPAFDLLTLSPRLSRIVDSKNLVFDIRKLEYDTYSFPYHFHRNAEELILVLSGSMTLRTEQGFEIVKQGQLIFFEIGETSAHQFYNHEKEPCTYLDIRTTLGMDIAEYPDSGKVNIMPYGQIYEKKSKVDYNKGEGNVRDIWEKLKKRK
jgi:uncharacterized cupin superfamily protein